jgi:ABC-type multidrug transport system ATPase subunit
VNKTARKFPNFSAAEKADRDFYKRLTGNERLQILVELFNHDPEQRLERVSRIIKFPRR